MLLLNATKQGRIFMVKYLLNSGNVNINETDKHGQTSLIKACLLKETMAATRRKLIRLLLSKGASVGNVDVFRRNVLMWACFLGKIDVVEILLDRCLMDLDFNNVDLEGNTALHYVATSGDIDLMTLLVKPMKRFGICVDKRNVKGMTPLLVATKHGKEDCARVLLDNGASPNTVDPETLMNAKELAESAHLESLTRLISVTHPSTQSRCVPLSSQLDGSNSTEITPEVLTNPEPRISKSIIGSSEIESKDSTRGSNLNFALSNDQPRHAPSASLQKRKERKAFLDEETGRKRGRSAKMSAKEQDRFLEISQEKYSPLLKKTGKMDFLEISPQDNDKTADSGSLCLSECGILYSGIQPNENIRTSPYDLRDLKNVLSLYGEQNSSSFRIGFSTPVMTSEQFQEYLKAMTPIEPPVQDRRVFLRPSSGSSTSSAATSASSHSLRLAPARKDERRRHLSEPYASDRRASSATPEITCPSIRNANKTASLNRNLSDPAIQVRLPVPRKESLRRKSLMTSIQLQYFNSKTK